MESVIFLSFKSKGATSGEDFPESRRPLSKDFFLATAESGSGSSVDFVRSEIFLTRLFRCPFGFEEVVVASVSSVDLSPVLFSTDSVSFSMTN